jgi:hypothetical protein
LRLSLSQRERIKVRDFCKRCCKELVGTGH